MIKCGGDGHGAWGGMEKSGATICRNTPVPEEEAADENLIPIGATFTKPSSLFMAYFLITAREKEAKKSRRREKTRKGRQQVLGK